MKKHRKNSGFTLIELMIVIGIMVVLITLIAMGIPAAFNMVRNLQCNNNLKNIQTALTRYEDAYKRLPDRGGDLFLAKLYLTGYITDWDTFICPADASEDGAGFVLSEINKKCPPPDGKWHEYENYYMDEDYTGDPKESQFFLDVEAEWEMSNSNDRTFEPGEISYAAVWNRHGSEDEDDLEADGWEKKYEIKSISMSKKKPVVCDDFESQNIDEEEEEDEDVVRMVHGDHINVLYSNGDIDSLKDIKDIGEDAKLEYFKALRN